MVGDVLVGELVGALVALVPVGEVMVTSTVPGTMAAGALAVIEVAELTVTPEAAVGRS